MLGKLLADFMRFAGERGISVFPDYTDKELETELRAGRQAMQSAKRKRRKRA